MGDVLLHTSAFERIGEFLPDPDYPRRKTAIRWCKHAGFELVSEYGGALHYVLTFRKSTTRICSLN